MRIPLAWVWLTTFTKFAVDGLVHAWRMASIVTETCAEIRQHVKGWHL